MYVNVKSLKVRKDPNLKSIRIGTLEKGDSVEILEESKEATNVGLTTTNWGRVSVKGMNGWVFEGYLSPTAPALVSKKESVDILKKYNRFVKKCEINEAKLLKKDPEYQNCSPCGCGFRTAESIQNDRGCKQYKLDEIRKIAEKDGYKFKQGSSSSSVLDYFKFYGDNYCLGAVSNSWSDCPETKIDFTIMKHYKKNNFLN